MDPKRLLAVMADRLYDDIKFVTEQNPTQIVDDDGARAYNVLLLRVRKHFSQAEPVADFQEWAPRTIKYKDALVVAGQLAAMVRALSEVEARPFSPAATPVNVPQPIPQHAPTPVMMPPAAASLRPPTAPIMRPQPQPPAPPPRPHDEELYGSALPPKRNDDGTIPFSLE